MLGLGLRGLMTPPNFIFIIYSIIIIFSELLLGRSRRSREDSKDEHISYNLRRTVRTVRYV